MAVLNREPVHKAVLLVVRHKPERQPVAEAAVDVTGAMVVGQILRLVQHQAVGEHVQVLPVGALVARAVAQTVTPAATELVVIGAITQPHHARAIVTATAVLAVVRRSIRGHMVLRAVIN